MKRLMLFAAALALASCGKVSVQTASSYTVGSADAAYITAEAIGALAVQRSGLTAATFHDMDTKAYTALLVLRAARAAGDEATITSANTAFNAAIAALTAFKEN